MCSLAFPPGVVLQLDTHSREAVTGSSYTVYGLFAHYGRLNTQKQIRES